MAQQGWTTGPATADVRASLTSSTASGTRHEPCHPAKFATPTSWTDAIEPDDAPANAAWPLFVQPSEPSDGVLQLAEVRGDPDHPAVVVEGHALGDELGLRVSAAFRKRQPEDLANLLAASCSEGAEFCGAASVDFSGTMTIRMPLTLCGPTIVSTTAVLKAIDAVVAPGYSHEDDVWHGRWTWQILSHRTDGLGEEVFADTIDLISPQTETGSRTAVELSSGTYEVVATLLSPSALSAMDPDVKPAERVTKLACEMDVVWATQEASLSLRIRPFDLDGSGEIDMGDLALTMLDFGPCADCGSDVDGSGEVDQGDLALLLLNFGAANCG
jgi:hypothetical protein